MYAGKKNKASDSYTFGNQVKLIRGGRPYFDCLLKMISAATTSIHLQTYIFDEDETGMLIAAALKAAAAKKVKVYLLVDGYASKSMSRSFIQDILQAGIRLRFFNPIFKSWNFYFGRRMHHKVVVVDEVFAMVGGMNIANRYNDLPGQNAWLDFALYVKGEAARELFILCWKTWKNYPAGDQFHPGDTKINNAIVTSDTCEVAVRQNDWVRRKNEISATYVEMFRNAKSQIIILCSYFLPGRMIRRQLRYAARRGIRIKVITAGISDIMLAKYAERYLYGWMLKTNIELYEYQPVILHGKIAVCDNEWMTIGSYNINNISTYASVELNLNVRCAQTAKETEEILLNIASKDCIRITPEYYTRTKNIFKQFVRWFSYELIRLIFYLFTFYFRRHR